jgi:hypothetical protein
VSEPRVEGEGPCVCQEFRNTSYGDPQKCALCNGTGVLPIIVPPNKERP